MVTGLAGLIRLTIISHTHFFFVPIFDLNMFSYSCKMGVPGKTEGTIFSPIPCEVILTGPERVGGKILQTSCKVVTRIHIPNKH